MDAINVGVKAHGIDSGAIGERAGYRVLRDYPITSCIHASSKPSIRSLRRRCLVSNAKKHRRLYQLSVQARANANAYEPAHD